MKPVGICLLVALALPATAAEEKTTIAIMALRADVEIEAGTVRTLNEVMLSEFDKYPHLKTIGYSDVTALLQHEDNRVRLSDCLDDSCLAEVGGALGARVVAVPSLGAVGKKYVVNLKLLDVANAAVLGRTSEVVERDDDELLAAFKRAVDRVIATALPSPEGATPRPVTTSPEIERPWTFRRAAPWVTLGLAAAAGAAGGIVGGLASGDEETANGEVIGTATWRDAKAGAEDKALVADILFGLAGAAAVTTLVLFLVGDDDEPGATVSFTPTPGGGVAGCSVRF